MTTSVAHVATDAPERYAKQLCEHLGRRSESTYADGIGRIVLTAGVVELRSAPGVLTLTATAGTPADLAVVEAVAGGHLERFGRRAELVVQWTAQDT
jgi:uncharacterized protein